MSHEANARLIIWVKAHKSWRCEHAARHLKLCPGKSEQQKKKLAEEITKAVMSTLHYGEELISVGIEEVKAKDWASRFSSRISSPNATLSIMKRDTRHSVRACRLAALCLGWPSISGTSSCFRIPW